MSSGITSTLFLASVEGETLMKIGTTSNANSRMPCTPNAMIWLQPKFSSFDQMSFTLTGLIPAGNGATLVGEKNSPMRSQNPPKFEPQATARRLFTGPFGTGADEKKSFKLLPTPPPNSVGMSGDL